MSVLLHSPRGSLESLSNLSRSVPEAAADRMRHLFFTLVKGARRVHDADLRGLRAVRESHRVKRALVVCLEREPRVIEPRIEILPWRLFLERLWAGDLI